MLRSTLLFACLLFSLLGAGCKSSDDAAGGAKESPEFTWNDVVLPRWRLIELNGAPVQSSRDLELAFEGTDRVSGHTGVNQFMGSCKRGEGYTLKFGGLASTMMASSEEAMALESSYLAALERVDAVRIVDEKLELMQGGEVSMRFARTL